MTYKGFTFLVLFLFSSLAAKNNPLEFLIKGSLGKGDLEKGYREKLAKEPEQETLWFEWVHESFEYEQPEKTLSVIEEALTHLPRSAHLWRMKAEVYRYDGISGPKSLARPGHLGPRAVPSTLSEKEFKALSWEKTIEALDHVLALEPKDAEATQTKMTCLMNLERWDQAVTFARSHAAFLSDPALASLCAASLTKLERKDEARQVLEQALARSPRASELHRELANLEEAEGHKALAEEEKQKALFFGSLLPDSKLEFTPENFLHWQNLFSFERSKAGYDTFDSKKCSREVDALGRLNSEESSELLATLAFNHVAHGAIEDRAFDILAAREERVRLVRILTYARSTCTLRSCFKKMVELRCPGTFEALCRYLDRDGGMFPIGVVARLHELNDPRCVPVLLNYIKNSEAPFLEEAVLVLAQYPRPDVLQHFNQLTKTESTRNVALVALYLATGKTSHLKGLKPVFKKEPLYDLEELAGALRNSRDSEAQVLVKIFDGREAAEKAAPAKKAAK